LTLATGCQRLLVSRITPAPLAPAAATIAATSAPLATPAPGSMVEERSRKADPPPLGPELNPEVEANVEPSPSPTPATPLLDAALRRASTEEITQREPPSPSEIVPPPPLADSPPEIASPQSPESAARAEAEPRSDSAPSAEVGLPP